MKNLKRVLVPLAEGSEELELVAVVDILRRAGAQVEMVAVDGKIINCSKGVKIVADKSLDEIEETDYDAVIIPGGMPGADNIRKSEKFIGILKRHAERKATIGAICASPALVLDYHGITQGKKVTCHPEFSHMVKNGVYEPEPVVVDSNIVTGKSAGYAIDFALKVAGLLFPDEVIKGVCKGLGIL